jgi:hypothetical protein
MKYSQKIKKIFHLLTVGNSPKPIKKHWVYKLNVGQVSLLFESEDISCFGFFNRKKKLAQFTKEYNQLFNLQTGNKEINAELFVFKMALKRLKLRAMYSALLNSVDCENSKREFAEMFGHEFAGVSDIQLIVDESNRLADKIKALRPQHTQSKEKSITFSQLVIIVETSRGLPIDRRTKLYEFKKMYEIELQKWHKT